MARIIYAVAGEGYGHSSRAHLVGQRFLDAGHEVMFVASQKALQYLRPIYGHRVREIFGLSFAYRRGRIDPIQTFTRNLFQVARSNSLNKRLFNQVYRSFDPDLAITDFEPFTGWWALRNKVPGPTRSMSESDLVASSEPSNSGTATEIPSRMLLSCSHHVVTPTADF